MMKALRRVLELARQDVNYEPPTAAALQLIALTSNGDLRSAVNSVQMLCTQAAAAMNGNGKKRKGAAGNGGSRKVAVLGKDARGWIKAKLDVPKDIRAV
jgi:cell cycle checkpoint protein